MKEGYDYYCFNCNVGFSIQSDMKINTPVNNCCFCGSEDIQ